MPFSNLHFDGRNLMKIYNPCHYNDLQTTVNDWTIPLWAVLARLRSARASFCCKRGGRGRGNAATTEGNDRFSLAPPPGLAYGSHRAAGCEAIGPAADLFTPACKEAAMAGRSPRFALSPFAWPWLVLAIGIAAPANGEEPAERLAALVGDLGNASFARRQQAEESLLNAPSQADAILRQALVSNDPEVRARASAVVRRRRMNAVWQPTMVRIPQGQITLAQWQQGRWVPPAGDHEPRQSGSGSIIHWRGAALDPAALIRFPAEELPLLEACAVAAEQLGCEWESPYVPAAGPSSDRPGLRFQQAQRGPIARSVEGPLGVELVGISQSAETHELQLDLRLLWEAGFELVGHSKEPGSIRLSWGEGERRPTEFSLPVEWHTADRRTRPIRVTTRLAPGETIDRVREIAVQWPLCAAAGRGLALFEQPAAGAALATEGGELRIERWQIDSHSGAIHATLVAENIRSWPEPAEALLRNYQWSCHPPCAQETNMCELTSSGCRWQVTFHPLQEVQRLEVAYRHEFSMKRVEFRLEGLDVQHSPAALGTLAN